jgi:hypothetical protein
MNKLFKTLSFLAVMALWITACGTQAVASLSEEPAVPVEFIPVTAVTYDALLDQSLMDPEVADFLTRHDCSGSETLQLCPSAGMALWMDADQKVESILLSAGNADGFAAYPGQLPYGLAFTDTKQIVEQKLRRPVEIHAPQAGWDAGLPDEGVTVDHFHYQAIYTRFGLSVIYNSPSATDNSATIKAILVTQ